MLIKHLSNEQILVGLTIELIKIQDSHSNTIIIGHSLNALKMFKYLIIKGYNALLGLNMFGVNRPVCITYRSVTLIKQKKHTFFNRRHTLIIYDVPLMFIVL